LAGWAAYGRGYLLGCHGSSHCCPRCCGCKSILRAICCHRKHLSTGTIVSSIPCLDGYWPVNHLTRHGRFVGTGASTHSDQPAEGGASLPGRWVDDRRSGLVENVWPIRRNSCPRFWGSLLTIRPGIERRIDVLVKTAGMVAQIKLAPIKQASNTI